MATSPTIPKTHRALVLTSTAHPPTVETLPVPTPTPGSVIIEVLLTNVLSYMRDVISGALNYPFPTPLVPGSSAIARIAATGPDTTLLSPGALVWTDITLRGRDDPAGAIALAGIHEGYTPGSRRLMESEWRNSTYAQFAKVPLENCHVLDEARLLGAPRDGGLGYTLEALVALSGLMVPYGGLRAIDLRAGETVVVAPATGGFGGGAVQVALAMGARVIAMGRKAEALKRVAAMSEMVETVQIVGDQQAEMEALMKFGRIDALFDISPAVAEKSTHIRAAIMALRPGGRVSLMGGVAGDLVVPYTAVMHKNLVLRGTFMYPREAVPELIKMVEIGVLKLGDGKAAGKYRLDQWKEAFDCAAENAGSGNITVLAPGDV